MDNRNEFKKDFQTGRLGPDEEALAAAGLTRPDDGELERIVQESLAENFSDAFADEEPVREEPKLRRKKKLSASAPIPEGDADAVPTQEKAPLFKKLRPKMKGAYGMLGIPHLLATVIWALIIIFIGGSLGQLGWICAADLLALGKEPMEATITVGADDDIADVSEKLQAAGLIRYPSLFQTFAKFTGKGENILFGNITFNSNIVYDYNALINALSYRSSRNSTVEVMIPEGYNSAQIYKLLEENGVCRIADMEAYAVDGKLEEYWFLQGIERGHKYSLEGFLFPDTYEFYVNDSAENVFNKFLSNFNYRFSDEMRNKISALNRRFNKNYTVYDVLIMASIVEKEAANADESFNIASVFYNRLTSPNFVPRYLGSDATILYATEYRDKDTLTTDPLINKSPYNTYTHEGLPPTPIANPGLSSIEAALTPASTSYLYFVLDKNAGVHRFSQTLAQHQQWSAQLGLS